jgi:hypothetical protein
MPSLLPDWAKDMTPEEQADIPSITEEEGFLEKGADRRPARRPTEELARPRVRTPPRPNGTRSG